MGSNHRKGKGDVDKSTTGNYKLSKKNSVLSARKDIERLIVQGSRRRRDKNQRQTSHMRMMVLILTNLYFYFLSPLLFAIQKNMSEFWIRVLPIYFFPSGSNLLVLKN